MIYELWILWINNMFLISSICFTLIIFSVIIIEKHLKGELTK